MAATVTRRQFLTVLGSSGVVLVGAAAGLGCDDRSAAPDEPTLRLGEEACGYCGMLIDDRRYCAAWIAPDGSQRHFDDVGCLVHQIEAEPPPAASRLFVTDFHDESWTDATAASYVASTHYRSPMASGLVAFATADAARSLASKVGGEVHDWSALPAAVERLDEQRMSMRGQRS